MCVRLSVMSIARYWRRSPSPYTRTGKSHGNRLPLSEIVSFHLKNISPPLHMETVRVGYYTSVSLSSFYLILKGPSIKRENDLPFDKRFCGLFFPARKASPDGRVEAPTTGAHREGHPLTNWAHVYKKVFSLLREE